MFASSSGPSISPLLTSHLIPKDESPRSKAPESRSWFSSQVKGITNSGSPFSTDDIETANTTLSPIESTDSHSDSDVVAFKPVELKVTKPLTYKEKQEILKNVSHFFGNVDHLLHAATFASLIAKQVNSTLFHLIGSAAGLNGATQLTSLIHDISMGNYKAEDYSLVSVGMQASFAIATETIALACFGDVLNSTTIQESAPILFIGSLCLISAALIAANIAKKIAGKPFSSHDQAEIVLLIAKLGGVLTALTIDAPGNVLERIKSGEEVLPSQSVAMYTTAIAGFLLFAMSQEKISSIFFKAA